MKMRGTMTMFISFLLMFTFVGIAASLQSSSRGLADLFGLTGLFVGGAGMIGGLVLQIFDLVRRSA